jgi:hypothetical protein
MDMGVEARTAQERMYRERAVEDVYPLRSQYTVINGTKACE